MTIGVPVTPAQYDDIAARLRRHESKWDIWRATGLSLSTIRRVRRELQAQGQAVMAAMLPSEPTRTKEAQT